MLLEEFEILRPAIEPEDVPGAFYDEIGENTCIDQMKVDNQIALVLDERPIHVGKPVDDHQHHTETGTHAVASRFFRTFDQATAPVSENCRSWSGRMFI